MPNLHPTPRIQIVTVTADELMRIVEDAAARGYTRAAEARERAMEALADRLETATTAVGLKAYLSVREAALYAGRSEDTVRRWIKAGMPAQAGTRGYVIRRDELDAWRSGELNEP